MNILTRPLSFIVCLVLINGWVIFPTCALADEQDGTLEQASSISRMTGRPVLAVAGTNT